MGSCTHRVNGDQDFSKTKWHPIDSVFSYIIENRGNGTFRTGDLLEVDLQGGIVVATGQWTPVSQIDSKFAPLATFMVRRLLDKRLSGKLGRNAEGYVKVDFGTFFPHTHVHVMAYLPEAISAADIDSLAQKIRAMREVASVAFISKDEAKRLFIADGHSDFSSVLEDNPLPASLDVTVKDEYCTPGDLVGLKMHLEDGHRSISDVVLPSAPFELELKNFKRYYFVFRFKT